VCADLQTLYREHLRTIALRLINSHGAADAQLGRAQWSVTIDESKSLAFAPESSVEDAALELRQLSLALNIKIPMFSWYWQQVGAEQIKFRRDKYQRQLMACVQRSDIITWARLEQIMLPCVDWSPDRQVSKDHFEMLYTLLTSDVPFFYVVYERFLGECIVESEELAKLLDLGRFKPLQTCPTRLLTCLAEREEALQRRNAKAEDKNARFLGLWVSTGFIRNVIWPSVHTLDDIAVVWRLIKPELLEETDYYSCPSRWRREKKYGPLYLASLFVEFMCKNLNVELWKDMYSLIEQLYPDYCIHKCISSLLLEELEDRFLPDELPSPEYLDFMQWCSRTAKAIKQQHIEAEDEAYHPFYWTIALINIDGSLSADEKIAAKRQLFNQAIEADENDAERELTACCLAKSFERMAVSDCLEFCNVLYLFFVFCYQTNHRTCSDDEYDQLCRRIQQSSQKDEWQQMLQFWTLKKLVSSDELTFAQILRIFSTIC
jgi:hypothetical protein